MLLRSGRKTVFCLLGVLLGRVAIIGNEGRSETVDDAKAAALVAWEQIASVLLHPRCLNCHQEKTPLQGDARRIHYPPVARADYDAKNKDGVGVGPMKCLNCHNELGNNEMSGVPGARGWALAPVDMKWEGLSGRELCRMLIDTERNGNRSPEKLVEHMDTDSRVLWGWAPGGRRQPVPILFEDFVRQLRTWEKGGAPCPD